MQVVVQARALGLAEESGSQVFQIRGTHGLGPGMLLVLAVEQAVDVLLDIALATADRRRIAEQEEDPRARLQLTTGNAVQQAVEQLDGGGFVAVDARREQQIQAIVAGHWRRHFQRAFGQPAQARALGRQLDLRCRFVAGQGQFKQFAEGKHRSYLNRDCSQGHARARRRRARPLPSPVPG